MAKEKRLDANGVRKFGILDSVSYAAGDFGCNMSFALKGTLTIFWSQFMGLGDSLYALLLIFVQIWDAINDPLIGSMIDADRRKYKRNKFLAYIWAGSIGLLVAGALCFIPIPNAPHIIKVIVFLAGYVIWDAFYTVANVPYGSLLSLISNDVKDRASLSAWRSVGSMIGNMVPMVILPFLIWKDRVDANGNPVLDEAGDVIKDLQGYNVFWAALIMGVLGFISFQFMIRTTKIRVDTNVKINEATEKFNVFKAFGNFIKNRPAVGATLAAMGMFIGMQGAATAVTVLFQTYFKNPEISGVIQLFSMIPILCFTPFARKAVAKFGKKELCVFGSLCSVVAGVGLVVLPITPDTKGLAIYIVCQLIYNLGLGIYSTVSWALMGDAIDYNEWKTGKREEGIVYSLHSFFRKLAQGAGPSIVLVIMVALGYIGENGGAQTAEVALNMRYLVAVLFLLSAVLEFIGLAVIYNLDKKTLAKMNAELGRGEEEIPAPVVAEE
ncbi:MAG: MFS transporter [Clostridia bacterium]|nr:MFS transporter [Clostridia bacterium]